MQVNIFRIRKRLIKFLVHIIRKEELESMTLTRYTEGYVLNWETAGNLIIVLE